MSWLEGERWGERRVVYVCDQLAVFTVSDQLEMSDSQQLHLVWPAVGPGLVSTQPRPVRPPLTASHRRQLSLRGNNLSRLLTGKTYSQLRFSLFPIILARQSRAERLGSVWLAQLTVFPLLKSLQGRSGGEVETVGLCWGVTCRPAHQWGLRAGLTAISDGHLPWCWLGPS